MLQSEPSPWEEWGWADMSRGLEPQLYSQFTLEQERWSRPRDEDKTMKMPVGWWSDDGRNRRAGLKLNPFVTLSSRTLGPYDLGWTRKRAHKVPNLGTPVTPQPRSPAAPQNLLKHAPEQERPTEKVRRGFTKFGSLTYFYGSIAILEDTMRIIPDQLPVMALLLPTRIRASHPVSLLQSPKHLHLSQSPRMASATVPDLSPRHIQDHASAESLEPHWGYADRVVPCVNDPGSCAYLDVVYDAHDVGMIYTGIIWATIGGILLIWAVLRRVFTPLSRQNPRPLTDGQAESAQNTSPGFLTRLRLTLWSYINRFLLPDCCRPIFGRTTRLQVLILAILTGYLTIWTFAGMVYGIWITPVAAHPGKYNTRSSLGPFADRVGVLAYALTPFSVLLANRESLLSVLTGIPYQNFNFLHRWLGYIIVVQSSLHTIGWSIIEIRLYQPQPQVAQNWIVQLYMIWGVVAMGLLLLLYVLSLPPVIRLTGYEFFRKSHYVLALVYMGACIGHWEQLHCFLTPAILLWFIDRAARGVRTFLVHYNFVDGAKRGFVAARASMTTFPHPEDGDVVRLDFEHPHEAWQVGQHFYLCFPESSIWQSHPFTPLNAPVTVNGRTRHSYIFRGKQGETKKIAELAARKSAAAAAASADKPETPSTSVVLTGPYGDSTMRNVTHDANILCIAGGTGITYVLPVLLSLLGASNNTSPARKIELVWVVRHAEDAEWVGPELDLLSKNGGISLTILPTRDAEPSSSDQERSSDAENEEKQAAVSSVSTVKATSSRGHPDLGRLIREFVEGTARGRTIVFASGPPSMLTDARAAAAACNSGAKVWKGEERCSVDFVHDERMER
ncbi:hypothetical protein SODALDRAFT_362339 [Sodiomyces alkalinus F11]|uniref:FAD-binding FR-type domain-containing protein n=1 Tax=Sodiomyces alkalinus (strain CBS 110278 / VKM F-3762 / F11) TaxID=1314773 RepID=A0A3N2PPU7_SODAK|nr:hypothetical protein SODALDRAFT_362339 [Sodiomyces alkalinus F11]ROT36528.1 hypothetical protein SODALDRAFT_362339 [Sodiomyces alkalinus F11]